MGQSAPATHPLQEIQAQTGNAAIQRLLRSGGVQAKMRINSPDDPEEREADAAADQIMHPQSIFGGPAHCACDGSDEKCEACRSAAVSVRRLTASTANPGVRPAPAIVEGVLRSAGRPLDASTRRFFEPRFGREFDHIRVHTEPDAEHSARSIQARAYTAGNHLVFDRGEFAPETEEGKRLLAHELTHTIQQGEGGTVRRQTSTKDFPLIDLAGNPIGPLDLARLAPQGISGPLEPGVVKEDEELKIVQVDAEHTEIDYGEAWVKIAADAGVKYSYYVEPPAARPPAEPAIFFPGEEKPAPPPQRVVRVAGPDPRQVQVSSFVPPAEIQQLVIHTSWSGGDLPASVGQLREEPLGKSSINLILDDSVIQILTPEDRPTPPPPGTYPNGSRYAYSIEPDWTGPLSLERRVWIVASPGVQVPQAELKYQPVVNYGRRLVPEIIRVPHPAMVPGQGTVIKPENFMAVQVYGDVKESEPIAQQSGVLTASTGRAGVTISEPYSEARVTIRPWQPELGAAFAWQVVPAGDGKPSEVRIVAEQRTYIEFAEPVPYRLRDPYGPVPTFVADRGKIGEGWATELKIVEVYDRAYVPIQGTPLNLEYYLQFGKFRDPDAHQWLGTDDTWFIIADTFIRMIPFLGEGISIVDFLSAAAKGEDIYGRKVTSQETAVLGIQALIGLLPLAGQAFAGAGRGITNAERALLMTRRIMVARGIGTTIEEAEASLLRATTLAADAQEAARLARASRALEKGEEILEEDMPAVQKALQREPELPRLAGVLDPSHGPVRFILPEADVRPSLEQPGFTKQVVDKFKETGEVAPELETVVREQGGTWEEGRAAVQQALKDATRDPAAGVDAAAAQNLAEKLPAKDPHPEIARRPDPPIDKLLESGGDRFLQKRDETLQSYRDRLRSLSSEVEQKGDVDAWMQYEHLMERLDEDAARLAQLRKELPKLEAEHRRLDNALVRARRAMRDRSVKLTEEEKLVTPGQREKAAIEKAAVQREIKGLETRGLARSAAYEYNDTGKLKPCFAPGTPVLTPDGTRAIELLRAGDLVRAWDWRSSTLESRRVLSVTRSATTCLVRVRVGATEILSTRQHPFWVEDTNCWREAASLSGGQTLKTSAGFAKLQSVALDDVDSPTVTLEVEELHNFFVGNAQVLVHNGPSGKSFDDLTRKLNRIYRVVETLLDGSKRVIYVGQTWQTLEERFAQHLRTKPHWQNRTLNIELEVEGKWTNFETAVWERHTIEVYKLQNPALENDAEPLAEGTFNRLKRFFQGC